MATKNDAKQSSFDSQTRVKFIVSEVPFTMSYETLMKHSKSRLALLVNKNPNAIKEGEYFFVDRDPEIFKWIREVYRDGPYKNRLPNLTLQAIENELRYFGLPDTSRLGIEVPSTPVVSPTVDLFKCIMTEIKYLGLIDFLPVDVIVYYERKSKKVGELRREILVLTPPEWPFVPDRDGAVQKFMSLLPEGQSQCEIEEHAWGRKLKPINSQRLEYVVVDLHRDSFFNLLNEEAAKYDLMCRKDTHEYGEGESIMKWNVLSVDYKSESS